MIMKKAYARAGYFSPVHPLREKFSHLVNRLPRREGGDDFFEAWIAARAQTPQMAIKE